MTVPVWMLLGFALWTIVVLLFTVGVYRWSRILSGQVEIRDFRADRIEGEEWYRRSMRAHANCLENLPVFAAIVLALYAGGISTMATDIMAIIVLIARICQSVVHVAFVQTNRMVSIRFLFFFVQLLCFIGMALTIIQQALF